MGKSKVKFYILYLILTVVFLLILFFAYAGSFLIKNNEGKQSESTIIVLMGSINSDRELKTLDEFKIGDISKIIIVNNKHYNKLLDSLGIPDFSSSTQFQITINKLGIPDSFVKVLDGPAKSTRDEAKYVIDYVCKDSTIHNVKIITSSFHTRRAYMIFKKQMNHKNCNINIVMTANPYTEFKAKGWWKDRESSKIVFSEWIKLIHFVFWEQFFDN